MSRYPVAEWRPIPEQHTQPTIRPTQFIFHTQVGYGSLYDFYRRTDITVESHFWVSRGGNAEQYLDTTVRGDANYLANMRPDGTGAVSCEFEGHADQPFTQAQVETAIKLLRQANERDGIPLRLCDGPSDPGIGWHVMWGAPGAWTPVAKTCPGKPRINQVPGIVAAARGEWDEMATKQEIKEALADLLTADNPAFVNAVRVAIEAERPEDVAAVWDHSITHSGTGVTAKARTWLAYTNSKVDDLRGYVQSKLG